MTDSTLHIGERRWELETARRIVHELADLIRPACERLEAVGSIRRGAPTVKDAELVAIPGTRRTVSLLELTDDLVARGIVEKALYGASQTTRWGEKYRGMLYQGIKVELFMADEVNYGAIKWLRSGPAEANMWLMQWLAFRKAPVRAREGYWWWEGKKLNTPDEDTLFAILGMPYLPPGERSEQRYKQLLQWNRQHKWPDFTQFVYHPPTPPQMTFAQAGAWVYREEGVQTIDEKLAADMAESKYHTAYMARWNAMFERARRGEKLLAWEQRIVRNRIERTGGWL